jgi:tetratricopeptide (TPR) repeat protein
MKNRRQKKPLPAKRPLPMTRRKLWFFRLFVAIVFPVIFLLLVEFILRLVGFGYPTQFLLSSSHDGKKVFIQNNQFGWRFFGAEMARTPAAIFIPQKKAPDTVRIFVFGGSAAFGDPQPNFGLPHMLEAMLELRHPGTRFEVVNAAMTAINSNVVLPIARDCAGAGGDVWVIYLGNNEVVGPFGAGTVFGQQVPPLPLIHFDLALKATRIGQLIDDIRGKIEKPPPDRSEWGGMEMFLNQQVRQSDPRMAAVYDHFARNLADIIRVGRRSGAGVVVSTVPVNLRDCAPFASAHREGLSESDKIKWDGLYQSGIAAEKAGKDKEAAKWFHAAAQIDNRVAELRFRMANCDLALDEVDAARTNFIAARNLDTLRFRCDSRLNELIRQAVTDDGNPRVLLADAERAFAKHSPDGLPGDDLFYEHVHLTFKGNYLLARTLVPQIEKLLPAQVVSRGATNPAWPSEAECARRLGWSDWNKETSLRDILVRISDPPFVDQVNHAEQLQKLKAEMMKLAPALQPGGIRAAQKICEAAVAMAPDDPLLREQLTQLDQAAGDLPGAETNALRAVDLLPSSSDDWGQLGLILAHQRKFEAAAADFRHAFALDPENVWALQNLAQSLVELGHPEEAIRTYRRALDIKPRFGMAWLGLGQALEATGEKAEAQDCYHKALENPINQASAMTTMARFCESQGWAEAAATNFDTAIKLNPTDAMLYVEAGRNYAAAGHHAKAEQRYAEAVKLSPNLMPAHFLYGLELGRDGQAAAAAKQFQEAVRIMPDLIEARVNWGIALTDEGNYSNALVQFETVLQQSPTNSTALRYQQALQEKLSPRSSQ